jgi:hypothetical protein
MEFVVDMTTMEITVRHAKDLERFSVRAFPARYRDEVGGNLEVLDVALRAHAAGTVDPRGDALIVPAVIRRMAHEAASVEGSMPDAERDARFSSMLEYAACRGWVAEDGSVRAHVEWGN